MSVREELERIYNTEGVLTPAAVVDDARPEDAPLHSHFEWDDSVAGEQYRMVQARQLIRSVKVTVQPQPEAAPVQVRVFHNVADEDKPRKYVPLRVLMDDPESAQRVLARAWDEWLQLKRKYADLCGFLPRVRDDISA